MATRRSPSRLGDDQVLKPRRRDKLAAVFRPRSRSEKQDQISQVQATEQLPAAPLASQQSEASNLQPTSSIVQSINESREGQRDGGNLAESSALSIEDVDRTKDIWGRAFQDLRLREPELIERFEKQLALIDQPDEPSEPFGLKPVLIERIFKQKSDEREARRLVFHIGQMPVHVRAVGENIIKTLLWANESIAGALSSQPYASLAWSTVSIILPFLLNSSKQNAAMAAGFESIIKLMQLLRIREELYLSDQRGKVPLEFINSLVEVYSAIFEYEVRAINHLSQNAIKRGIMATFEFDDWELLLSKVQKANEQCSAFTMLFDTERETKQLSLIEQSNRVQSQMLDLFHSFEGQRQKDRQDDEETALMRSLASSYRSDKDFISKRIVNTCEWFFRDERFLKWRDTSASSLLWVSAGPGCGKSVLAKALIDESRLSKTIMTSTVCYFFFKDGQQQRTHSANALSAILHQLFRNPQLIRHGIASHKRFGTQLSANFSELWDVLMETATDPEAGEIICIIDALDECDDCDEKRCRRQFMSKIVEFFARESAIDEARCVKFLITSRPYEYLESDFERLPNDSCYIRFDGDEKSEQISQEINLVIDVKVKEFASSFSIEHQHRIAERLKEMNNMTYLWLFLTIDIIEKAPRSKYGKPSSIESLLSSVPTEISQAYESILNRSLDKVKASVLLQVIAAATRTLSLAELNIALTLATQEPTCLSHETLDLWPQENFGSVVKNICGLLVIVHDEKVSLLHQTVREFLIPQSAKDVPCNKGDWKGSIQLPNAHGIWSLICLGYLTFSDFETKNLSHSLASLIPEDNHGSWTKRILEIPSSTSKSYPLLDYSARNWITHYKSQADEFLPRSQILSERLCYPDLLYLHVPDISGNWYATMNKVHNWHRLGVAADFGLGDLVKRFVESGDAPDIHVGTRFSDTITTPLMIASELDKTDVVRALLQAGADPTWQNSKRENPLSTAAWFGNVDTLQVFLDANVDINWHREGTKSSLQQASHNGYIEVVKLLVRNNASLVAGDSFYDHEALIEACSRGHLEVAEFLIEKGADALAKVGRKGPALHAACCEGKLKIVELLVSKGTDLHAQVDGEFKTSLQASCYEGSLDLVRYLLDYGVDVNAPAGDEGTALQVACNYTDTDAAIEIIELLVVRGAKVNVSDDVNSTPLQIACSKYDNLETIKFLVANGADINATGGRDSTPLQIACRTPDELENIEFLIQNGADVNDTGGLDSTPLQIACGTPEELEVIKLLIENGADVNIVGESTLTPLQWASHSHGNLELIRLLIENGANVNVANDLDDSALQIACLKYRGLEVIKILVENGADVNVTHGSGSPLQLVTLYQEGSEIIKFLIESHTNANVTDGSGTPLQDACNSKKGLEVVKFLIESGADVNVTNGLGSPLQHACNGNRESEVVRFTTEDGTGLNATDYLNPALSQIVRVTSDKLEVTKLLIESGADVNVRDDGLGSPLFLAFHWEDTSMAELLDENGATITETERQLLGLPRTQRLKIMRTGSMASSESEASSEKGGPSQFTAHMD